MMDSTDMSTPVTRGELQDALGLFRRELKQELTLERQHELQAAIAPLATKAELELWGGALVARMQHGEQRIDRLAQQTEQQIQQLDHRLQQFEQRLLTELARHTSAVHEAMRTQIKASTEPFDDLPGRVSRLETEVFGPKPERPTRRRKH